MATLIGLPVYAYLTADGASAMYPYLLWASQNLVILCLLEFMRWVIERWDEGEEER